MSRVKCKILRLKSLFFYRPFYRFYYIIFIIWDRHRKAIGSTFPERTGQRNGDQYGFRGFRWTETWYVEQVDSELRNKSTNKFSATFEVLQLVTDLLSDCSLANSAGSLLQEQLKEVARTVTIVRQQCRVKDRALCYTVQYTGLEVGFSCGNVSRASNFCNFQEETVLSRKH